jgi:protein-L-isoaspartate(D-aspartate) O-methyltransferase
VAVLFLADNPRFVQSDSYRAQRESLVENQLANAPRGKSITDTHVLRAMKQVPRHEFVVPGYESQAYQNRPLPIGHGQTISQPYIVARMTELLRPSSKDRVLEIGTGSGYQAAVLAEIVDEVYTIEIIEELHDTATKRLKRLGYDNVRTRHGDGYKGWKEHAPYDKIILTAAPPEVPQPLLDQLKPGGRMVLPVGPSDDVQKLNVIVKTGDGSIREQTISRVRFVPFLREEPE